jgi:arylsulfatase
LSISNNIRRYRWQTVGALLLAAFVISAALVLGQDNIPQIPGGEAGPVSPFGTTPSAVERKPNIVFILADNVGYGDLGSYGGGELRGAPTPRLDELANQGIRLTQFLVEPGCTPSRAALMTGQYSTRSGLSLIRVPASHNTLPAGAFTMAQMLKEQGYATALFGKWHLGKDPQSLPTSHGFDEFYGIPPDSTWSDSIVVPTVQLTHVTDWPLKVLLEMFPVSTSWTV